MNRKDKMLAITGLLIIFDLHKMGRAASAWEPVIHLPVVDFEYFPVNANNIIKEEFFIFYLYIQT